MWNQDEIKINVHMIRHGMTPLNDKNCYIGSIDESLSENGANVIIQRASKKIYPKVQKVYVSPKKRTIETAKIIYPKHNLIPVYGFEETDFGMFEGKNYDQLKSLPIYRRWIDISRGMSPEEVERVYGDIEDIEQYSLPESKEHFKERVAKAFTDVLIESSSESDIALVVHGGTINAIIEEFGNEDFYKYHVLCGNGISTEIIFKIEDYETIKVSHFGVTGRIHS